MRKGMKTYKVKFIFFKLYKTIEVTATSVNEAEQMICEKFSIPKSLKSKCGFNTTLVK